MTRDQRADEDIIMGRKPIPKHIRKKWKRISDSGGKEK